MTPAPTATPGHPAPVDGLHPHGVVEEGDVPEGVLRSDGRRGPLKVAERSESGR